MDCDDERLDDITVGDDYVRAWEFFDVDEFNVVTGPSDLSSHSFVSHAKYAPDDTAFWPFTMTVAGNIVYFTMLSAVSSTLPVADLWWSLRETVDGMTRTIKWGRWLVHQRIT